MRRLSLATFGFVLALWARPAQANPIIDPRMIIDGVPIGSPIAASAALQPTSITGTTFMFTSNAAGGGFLDFSNDSGVDWFNLQITTMLPPGTVFPTDYFFGGNAFPFVTATLNGNILTILYSDFPPDGGGGCGDLCSFNTIFAGTQFTINLNNLLSGGGTNTDPAGAGGWGAFHVFSAQANVPEPGTWLLIATGLAGLVGQRRLRERFQRGARRKSSSSLTNAASD